MTYKILALYNLCCCQNNDVYILSKEVKKMRYIKNSMDINSTELIKELFRTREEEIYCNITTQEKKLFLKKSENYSKIYDAIDNIPDAFVETITGIKNSLQNYLEIINEIQGFENEKFYKEGFSDAINLILESSFKNTDQKNKAF